MIVECISDLHGHYPTLEGGDLLIVAGDLTGRDTNGEVKEFFFWLNLQKYTRKIFIAGNHDNSIQQDPFMLNDYPNTSYLCDSGTEFEGLKIWGSPWTKTFEGMNPHCKAFTCETEEKLAEKWALIPNDIDILVTHGPPKGTLDLIGKMSLQEENIFSGSLSLRKRLATVRPKFHIFGHVHESYGKIRFPVCIDLDKKEMPVYYTNFINCSYVNEHYEPVNKPIRIIL
jgi:Icc-related predicted phosphoesterase